MDQTAKKEEIEMRSRLAACMVVAVSIFLAGYGIAQAESVSVNGVALVIDPYTKMLGTGKSIGYLVMDRPLPMRREALLPLHPSSSLMVR